MRERGSVEVAKVVGRRGGEINGVGDAQLRRMSRSLKRGKEEAQRGRLGGWCLRLGASNSRIFFSYFLEIVGISLPFEAASGRLRPRLRW